MTRGKLAFAVFAGLVALELGLLTFVETATRPLERAGTPFLLQDIASGTAISQRMEVRADGFDEVRLDGAITSGSGPAVLRAELVEVGDDSAPLRSVRRTAVEVPASSTNCCTFRFDPVADSRFRAYRFDVTVGELMGRQLSLWIAPGPVGDSFAINGRFKRGFLLFSTGASRGTGVGRLRAASASKGIVLAVSAFIYNGALAALVCLLVNASDLRPA